jgi:hypothetical protein
MDRMVFRCCRGLSPRRNATAVAILTLVLGGCSGGSAINGHPAATLSGGSTGIPPGGPSQASGSSGKGGENRPARPGSVSSIFSSIPFNVSCPGSSTIWVSAGTTTTVFSIEELPSNVLSICFSGLGASSSPSLIITTPSGAQDTVDIHPAGSAWEWVLNPGPGQGPVDTIGPYSFEILTSAPTSGGSTAPTPTASGSASPTLTASGSASPTLTASASPAPSPARMSSSMTAGSSASAKRQLAAFRGGFVAASGRFTVVRPTEPRAEVIGGRPAAGQQLLVSLAGFSPSSAVFLTLYGPGTRSSTTFPLFLDLPALTTNASGEALAQWAVPVVTTAGYYGIWISPPPSRCSAQAACLPFNVIS